MSEIAVLQKQVAELLNAFDSDQRAVEDNRRLVSENAALRSVLQKLVTIIHPLGKLPAWNEAKELLAARKA